MNEIENRMLNLLKDLKINHGAIGLKAEYEDEGSMFSEVYRLSAFAKETGLELTIKIGGCSAISDMNEAKSTQAVSIVAPMIESPYAAYKFLNNAKKIFNDNVKLYINIETKYALNFINEILEYNFNGIILGRTDLTSSLGNMSNDVNNDRILEIAKELSFLTGKSGKEFIIGGSVTSLSIPFFKSIPYLSKYETRKIIFNSKQALYMRPEEGILKAVDFELMWLKNNRDNYNKTSNDDFKRMEILKSRFSI